jgi:hypothetical protein
MMTKAVDIERVIDDERGKLSLVILRHADLGMLFLYNGDINVGIHNKVDVDSITHLVDSV